MPTVSILVPHYNDAAGFETSLRSIEAQTWKGEREIVVYDDGSKPEHVERLEEIISGTPERVRLIRNPVNRGRPYARNMLLDAADGKYTTWCDSGDEYYPNKLEEQFEGLYRARYLGCGEMVWCTCNSHWQWLGTRKKKVVAQQVQGSQVSSLFMGTLRAYLYTLLGLTESFRNVGHFDLELPRLQDLDFFLRFVSKGGLLVLPPEQEPLCIYHKTDVGRDGREVLRCSNHIFDKHASLLMGRSRRFRRNRRFQQYHLAARFSSNNNDSLTAARFVGASALVNPIGFVRWVIKNKARL